MTKFEELCIVHKAIKGMITDKMKHLKDRSEYLTAQGIDKREDALWCQYIMQYELYKNMSIAVSEMKKAIPLKEQHAQTVYKTTSAFAARRHFETIEREITHNYNTFGGKEL